MADIKYWERIPWQIFYIPVYFKILIEGIRQRSLLWLTTINPDVFFSGLMNYSKYDIVDPLDNSKKPETYRWTQSVSIEQFEKQRINEGFSYPVILKPDQGERGEGVKVIYNKKQAEQYLNRAFFPLLMQEFIDIENEFSVMVLKLPGDNRFTVTSLLYRELPSVTGDGRSTIRQLAENHHRYRYYIKMFEKQQIIGDWNRIPDQDEKVSLGKVGSHCRGTVFYDYREYITPELNRVFDELTSPLTRFRAGRYDIKSESLSEMEKGNFKVIELNGVNAEPVHIYDPGKTLFRAWKELCQHWNYLIAIARDQKKNGIKPNTVHDFFVEKKRHKLRSRHRREL